jgi:capsular exopolysaccharide synthesis family protein
MLEQNKTEQKIWPEEMLQMRGQHIKTDPTVSGLVANIENLEQALIVDRQLLTPTNPVIKLKVELIEQLNKRLQIRKEESAKAYDKLIQERMTRTANAGLDIARTELEAIKTYEQRFRDILSKEDAETIGLGRKQLAIQELQDDLALTKEHYIKVTRRINDLEMERKRPARISVAYNAEVISVADKRLKLTIALLFGAMAFGVAVAFLMSKADQSMYLPNDITKKISIRIIGTTTCTDRIEKSLLPKMLVEDYQAIRANIDLFNNNGDPTPKKLVITSSGPGEGKTTMAINLAMSMAKSGKKVLLIDGDMRKPNIAHSLSLPRGTRGLQDFLFGKELKDAVYRISTKLDVLASDPKSVDRAYDLLASPVTRQYMDSACDSYDHVIIDTPPVLAFPDALMWAKMADAVILSGFAGKTNIHAFRETTERLAQINIKVLGSVMNNVRVDNSYNQYGYNDSSQVSNASRKNKRSGRRTYLLAANNKDHAVNRKPDKTV